MEIWFAVGTRGTHEAGAEASLAFRILRRASIRETANATKHYNVTKSVTQLIGTCLDAGWQENTNESDGARVRNPVKTRVNFCLLGLLVGLSK